MIDHENPKPINDLIIKIARAKLKIEERTELRHMSDPLGKFVVYDPMYMDQSNMAKLLFRLFRYIVSDGVPADVVLDAFWVIKEYADLREEERRNEVEDQIERVFSDLCDHTSRKPLRIATTSSPEPSSPAA